MNYDREGMLQRAQLTNHGGVALELRIRGMVKENRVETEDASWQRRTRMRKVGDSIDHERNGEMVRGV
jgi:hypothetical protein